MPRSEPPLPTPLTPAITTTLKALSGVGVDVATDKLTPGPVPSSATSEFEFTGPDFNGTAVGHFTKWVVRGTGLTRSAMHGDGSGDLSYEGLAIFDGAILGHKGTIAYAVRGTCTHADMLVVAELTFITATGTGELKEIAGTGSYAMKINSEETQVTLSIGCAREAK
ncbi:hypothetical protein Q8F55_007406 [Vanrija albida]|uniref:Thioesterase domain-containing protein n=1 Tax=Vanrija albida TaxID=181172 RepID=A0ABR3PTQ6_9TREE